MGWLQTTLLYRELIYSFLQVFMEYLLCNDVREANFNFFSIHTLPSFLLPSLNTLPIMNISFRDASCSVLIFLLYCKSTFCLNSLYVLTISSQNTKVSRAMSYGMDDRFSIPHRGQQIFSLLPSVYHGLFPRGKAAVVLYWPLNLNLEWRSKICGALLLIHHSSRCDALAR